MKIHELKVRENYDNALTSTLDAILQHLAPGAVILDQCAKEGTQQWYLHTLLSVYVTQGFCPKGRQFLHTLYANTPHSRRAILQKTALAFLTSSLAFRTALRPAFCLSTPIPNAAHLMIMPGNQRFRTFDFLHDTILVTPKHNFSAQGIQNEIQLRQRLSPSLPFIPPCQSLPNDAFQEPLLNAFPLNRLDKTAQHKAEANAFQCLQKLHQIDNASLPSADYLSHKRAQFEAAKTLLRQKFGGLCLRRLDTLYDCAEKILLPTQIIQTALTHGDFQPGNILARNDNPGPIFIDFEDAAPRACAYDYLTWQLRARTPRGLVQRIQNFTAIPPYFPQNLALPQSPKILLALWFIEEWIWLCQSSTRDGIQELPLGLQIQFKELQNITLG